MAGGSGTWNFTTQIAASDSNPVSAKMPSMPTARYSSGAPTSESANIDPIVAPIIAMILVRCCSRVRSAASAMATELIAPAPCRVRAAMAVQTSCAAMPRKLPAAKMTRPV